MRMDLTGHKYAHLTVLREGDGVTYGRTHFRTWLCKCDCGNELEVTTGNLRSGNTKSCGCTRDSCRKTNVVRLEGKTAYVTLRGGETMVCDADDWERLKGMYWVVGSTGYAITTTHGGRKGSKRILFHVAVLQSKPGYVVDHINRNPLDNRKDNLRYATKAENIINSVKPGRGVTGVRGVYVDKRKRRKYIARIKKNGKEIRIGSFLTLEEAAKARKAMEIHLFGEFSPCTEGGERE